MNSTEAKMEAISHFTEFCILNNSNIIYKIQKTKRSS